MSALFLLPGLLAVSPISGTVSAEISLWTATCPGLSHSTGPSDCGIPTAIATAPATAKVELVKVYQPGQAGNSASAFDFTQSGQSVASGKLTIFSVFPYASENLPPYIQVRFEMITPVRAVCLQSVRWKEDQMEIPPVICSAFSIPPGSDDGTQWGMTTLFSVAPVANGP
jgi:hypothetical protein